MWSTEADVNVRQVGRAGVNGRMVSGRVVTEQFVDPDGSLDLAEIAPEPEGPELDDRSSNAGATWDWEAAYGF